MIHVKGFPCLEVVNQKHVYTMGMQFSLVPPVEMRDRKDLRLTYGI